MRRVLVLAAIMGCGDDVAILPDASVQADAYVDLSGPVFAPDHLVEVSITMAEADWNTLRGQARTIGSVIEGNCLSQPQPSPFTKFPASITIDGTTFSEVSIKKKGFFGSLDPDKPSLKIEFDDYVRGQEYLGLEKLTLNNSHQDPSYVRQCITYQTFAAAGIVVPRCNFAHVRVNGRDLGIYVNVETIDHRLTKKRYADGRGNLYEGTLSDLRPGWLGTFDAKGGGDGTDLVPFADVVANASDASLVADLAPYVDVERFYTYWAMEILTNHWDGYANDRNNFFVYHDPISGQFDFIPWGTDATFQKDATFGDLGSKTGPVAVAANGALAHRLFSIEATKQRFIARQRELLTQVWNETTLHSEISRMENLIGSVVDSIEGSAWRTQVAGVRQFVTERRAKLLAALDAGPTWSEPLDSYPCLRVVAQLTGTFSTTWGTIGAMDPFMTGSGTLSITMDGTTTTLTPVGAKAGLDPNPEPNTQARALVQVFGVRATDNHIIAVSMSFHPATFVPREGGLGFWDGIGLVFDYNPGTGTASVIGYTLGTFTLTSASTTNGAAVTGSFTANADVQGTPP